MIGQHTRSPGFEPISITHELRKSRQEDQIFGFMLSYIMYLRPTWGRDPVNRKKEGKREGKEEGKEEEEMKKEGRER